MRGLGIRSAFGAALAASVALHLAVLTSPGWGLPSDNEPEEALRLEARLASPPAPVAASAVPEAVASAPSVQAAKPKKQRPKPRPKVAPVREDAAPAPFPALALDESVAAPAVADGEDTLAAFGPPPDVPQVSAPPSLPSTAGEMASDVRLPEHGRIRYVVTLGPQHLIVGRAVQTWRQDGASYVLKSVTETSGLVALFKRAKVVQVSEGTVTDSGLVPQEFRSTRNDSTEPSESATFDWSASRVALKSGNKQREAVLSPGAQDVLSAVFQLVMAPPSAGTPEFMVATGKSYNPQVIDIAGEEWLTTRVGDLRTLHLKARAASGGQSTDLWLALDHRNLPVRVRFTDKKGEVADMIAAEVEFEGVKLAEVASPLPPQ